MIKWENEKDNLQQLISDNKSYEEIGKMYNCTGANIKRVAKILGIELSPRRKINPKETFNKGTAKTSVCTNCGKEFVVHKGSSGKYCSKKCQKEFEHKEKYKLIVKGDNSIMRSNYNLSHFKNDILVEQGNECAICHCKPEHNGKPLVFVLDHIDGHASNNKRDNLRMICPNCDSQLETYKSKNKCGDRYYYRYHK